MYLTYSLNTNGYASISSTVGLLGEGGQFALPEGEWFCTECYSDTTTGENDHPRSIKDRDSKGIADIESGNSGANDDGEMDEGDEMDGRRTEPGMSCLFIFGSVVYGLDHAFRVVHASIIVFSC